MKLKKVKTKLKKVKTRLKEEGIRLRVLRLLGGVFTDVCPTPSRQTVGTPLPHAEEFYV
jgi:hypothetical protein